MPCAPAVEPPAWSRFSASTISSRLEVGSSTVPGGAGIDDDRDPVARVQPVGEQGQRALHQRQFVGLVHRSGDVDQEDEVGRRPRPPRQVVAAQADAEQPRIGVPRRRRHVGRDGERPRPVLRGGIIVAEIVQHLLGPHRRLRRQLAGVQHPPDIGVGAGVDVDREGRDRRLGDGQHRSDRLAVIAFAIVRRGHVAAAGRRRPRDPVARNHALLGPGLGHRLAGRRLLRRRHHRRRRRGGRHRHGPGRIAAASAAAVADGIVVAVVERLQERRAAPVWVVARRRDSAARLHRPGRGRGERSRREPGQDQGRHRQHAESAHLYLLEPWM